MLVAAALALAIGAFLLFLSAGRVPPSGPVASVLALLLVAPLAGRRLPERAALASPETLPRAARRSLLVIGIEGASWDLLTTFASEGSLPTFARLLAEGAAGPLASLAPYDRAALWTSAATGKRPFKHGVVAAYRREALSGTFRVLPLVPGLGRLVPPFGRWVREDGARRRSLTFWEILVSRGHEAAVLNWPCSSPARDGPVLWATDRFFAGDDSAAAARPAGAARRARLFRVSPGGLDRPLARALEPDGLPDGPARREPLAAAAMDLSVVGASLGALPAGPNNVAALVLSGLATPARLFGAAGDARYWGLASPEGAEARARALKAYYRFLDDTLADVLEREGRDRTVCLFAPVGWGPPSTAEAVVRFLRGRAPESGPDASRDGFVLLAGAGREAGREAHVGRSARSRADAPRPRGRAARARHGRPPPRRGLRRALRGVRERAGRHDVRARGAAMTRTRAVVACAALLGAALRLVHLSAWPPGPWIDEAYALRAARLLPPGAPLFGTTALIPAGEGFVNAWTPNLYLRFARAVDLAAGGGMASFRALSAVPALALFAALLLLAGEAARGSPLAFGAASALGACSMWLLTTGRWGWNAVATSALATLATWAGLRAARTLSVALALLAGACAGLGAYGYAAGRLFLAAPAVVVVFALARRGAGRPLARLAALALAAELAVVAPLLMHEVRHPERLLARERELSLLRHGGADAGLLLARNVADYTALFFLHGDANERHGDPARPIVPAAVAGLALVGAAWGAARGGPARALLLPAGLFLAGGLLASEDIGANAYRISPMAPYVLVLAGLGAAVLRDALAPRLGRWSTAALAALVAAAAVVDISGFARWGASPRTWGAFGGPERELADALVTASRGGPPARIVLDARTASRNPYVVEELLAPPGARRGPVVAFRDLAGARIPLRENVLYADGGALAAAGPRGPSGGGRRAGRGPVGTADVHGLPAVRRTDQGGGRESARERVPERPRRLERAVVAGVRKDEEASPGDRRRERASEGEREERLLGTPDDGGPGRQVLLAARERVREIERADRGGRRIAAVVATERVHDEARGREGPAEEEEVEDAPGAGAVRGHDAPPLGVDVGRHVEPAGVHEDETARLLGVLERERRDGPPAERVADEVGPVEGERAEQSVERGDAAGNPVSRDPAGRLAAPRAGAVRQEDRAAGADEGARRPGPVRRVGAEAVDEHDRALGRERAEHPDGQPRPVVRREDLAVAAGDREPLLHDRAVRGERVDRDRAEEEEETEGQCEQADTQKRATLAHLEGTVSRRSDDQISYMRRPLCGRRKERISPGFPESRVFDRCAARGARP